MNITIQQERRHFATTIQGQKFGHHVTTHKTFFYIFKIIVFLKKMVDALSM